ncbi:MAG: hypothetical protein HXS54_16715 [Theionarchaea archaeon]|nr:hypothetical protein [Theionarchaea archaeon]
MKPEVIKDSEEKMRDGKFLDISRKDVRTTGNNQKRITLKMQTLIELHYRNLLRRSFYRSRGNTTLMPTL